MRRSAVRARDPKLLVVNNAAFTRRGEQLLISAPTGRFLEELAACGLRVRVASASARYGEADTRSAFDLAGHPSVEVSSYEAPLTTVARLGSYLRALPWVLRETRAADFVYAFLPGHLPLLFVAASRLLRKPYALFLRGELAGARLAIALGRANFALATSEPLRGAAARAGVRADLATPMLEVSATDIVTERPTRSPGPWRLLFVGRVEAAKGIPELLDAVEILVERGNAVELDVVGWALEFDRHRESARRRGLDCVRFHGAMASRERIRDLYAGADLFVMPSRSEGFPRVLYEAMTYRVPIVTTFVGGIAARMRDGINCVEAPRRDPRGLAEAIERALRDAGLRERTAIGGMETITAILDGRASHARQVARQLRELGASGTRVAP